MSPSHPGTKIPFRQSVRQFPDAFEPYRNFGCTLDGHFPGTFFRFPLRRARELAMPQTCSESHSPGGGGSGCEHVHVAKCLPNACTCPSWGPSPRLSRCVCALMPLLCRNVWPLQSVELEAVVEYASKVCSHSVVLKLAPTCLHASCARAPKPRLIYLISPAMAQSLADNRSSHSCEPTQSCEARTMAIASAC